MLDIPCLRPFPLTLCCIIGCCSQQFLFPESIIQPRLIFFIRIPFIHFPRIHFPKFFKCNCVCIFLWFFLCHLFFRFFHLFRTIFCWLAFCRLCSPGSACPVLSHAFRLLRSLFFVRIIKTSPVYPIMQI